MRESLIHKNEKKKEPLISFEENNNKKKCCKLKSCILTSISLICLTSIGGLIYANIVCDSFTNDLCDINHHCPNYSPCDSGSGL